MSIKFRSDELTPAEASFLKWQYGFDEDDEPFGRVLWQAIGKAWEADAASGAGTRHLERLGCSGAYPEEKHTVKMNDDEFDVFMKSLD